MVPSENIKRLKNQLAGRIALLHHDTARAIEELTRAEARLPPYPGSPPGIGQASAIRFDLGSAYLAAGNDTDALARFQRIVDGGIQRIWNPIEFVRSLYHLGQIYERRGDRDRAKAFYRRFVQYWGDGDIDRERVAEARKRINRVIE